MYDSVILSETIKASADQTYRFVQDVANFPRWGTSFCLSAHYTEEPGWTVETSEGPIQVRFAPSNPYGVLDHTVTTGDGSEIVVPMRVLANGEGSMVMFTLFRASGMTQAEFERDSDMVRRDLAVLKRLLEA